MNPLVSVIVLCYQNFQYITQVLDSVFEQDYPNIELIVSDDGSVSFPEAALQAYVQAYAGGNITSWRLEHRAENVGTVRHLNRAIRSAGGDYIISIAADDMLDHACVLTACVRALSTCPDRDILMAQAAMYDEQMDRLLYYFTQPHIRDILLHRQESGALFNELIQHPYLPTVTTVFRRTFFEKYGYFDEAYDLVEDWPLHLMLARERIPILYMDTVTVRHRSGGISHGNANGTSRSFRRYLRDRQRIYQQEIRPYLAQVPPELRRRVKHQYRLERAWIDWRLNGQGYGIKGLLGYLRRNWSVEICKHLPDIQAYFCGKQWVPLLLGVLLNAAKNWFRQSSGCLFGAHSVITRLGCGVLSTLSTVLTVCGYGLLILYYVSLCYTCIVGRYRIDPDGSRIG